MKTFSQLLAVASTKVRLSGVAPHSTTFMAEKTTAVRSTSKWFAGLDSLRFVLALIVLLSHLKNPIVVLLRYGNNYVLRYIGMGFGVAFCGVAAVVAFFVISGFVIHYPNKNGIKNVKNFYIRRLIRVLIPLIVIKLLGLFLGSPENDVTWSLYCELIFYIIYPFLAKVPLTWKSKLLLSYALSAVIIGTVGRHDVLSMLTQLDRGWTGEFYHLGVGFTWLIGLPFWLFGVNIAQEIDGLTNVVSEQKILIYRSIVFVLASASNIVRFHAFTSFTLTMTILSVLIAKWLEAEIVFYRNATPVRFLENSGKFSYSLYLCHPLIIAFLLRIIPLNSYTYFLYLLICLGGAYSFYLLLERPSHILAEKITKPAR